MENRYRLIQRSLRSGTFYCVDKQTGKRSSLGRISKEQAQQILNAKNQAEQQPALNLQIARAYLAGSDSGAPTRTWQQAMEILCAQKSGSSRRRWERALPDRAFDHIRNRIIVETRAEILLKVLQSGTVSTNKFLRQIHNFCVDMSWLPWPLIPKRQWPPVRYKVKRAVTAEEHKRIVDREKNPELKAFYQMAWHLGASQSDLANLQAEDVDRKSRIICFVRMKTAWRGQQPPQIRFGREVEALLETLPKTGPLFPRIARMEDKHRAKEFRRRCLGLNIDGISLHSYRYAWAERAKTAGYPERFAQLALGHNSKAVHRAYAKSAQVTIPTLEEYEHIHSAITKTPTGGHGEIRGG